MCDYGFKNEYCDNKLTFNKFVELAEKYKNNNI